LWLPERRGLPQRIVLCSRAVRGVDEVLIQSYAGFDVSIPCHAISPVEDAGASATYTDEYASATTKQTRRSATACGGTYVEGRELRLRLFAPGAQRPAPQHHTILHREDATITSLVVSSVCSSASY